MFYMYIRDKRYYFTTTLYCSSIHSFKIQTGPAGRSGTWSTRPNPGEIRSIFFIFTVINRVLHFYLIYYPQNLKTFFFPGSCRRFRARQSNCQVKTTPFFSNLYCCSPQTNSHLGWFRVLQRI